jgi:hypothetical protein
VTKKEILFVQSLMNTVKGKMALLYENSEPYNVIDVFFKELGAAENNGFKLCGPIEEEEEL